MTHFNTLSHTLTYPLTLPLTPLPLATPQLVEDTDEGGDTLLHPITPSLVYCITYL